MGDCPEADPFGRILKPKGILHHPGAMENMESLKVVKKME